MTKDHSSDTLNENKSREQLIRELGEVRGQLAGKELECRELSLKLEDEARFRLLYERTPLSYQSLDENGRFIEVNQTWLDVMGYSREEVIGRSFDEFLHPDWRAHFKESFSRFKAVGEILGVEFEMVKKDGSRMLVSLNGKIGRDSHSHFQQTHCVFQDITERKQMEDSLRQSMQRLADELDAAKHLQQISTQLIQADNIEALYGLILDTAVMILKADFASIQIMYPERGSNGELRLLAHRGFNEKAAKFWEWAGPSSQSTWGIALLTGERVSISDVLNCESMAGGQDKETYLQAGIRAVQTTPLFSRFGKLLGMLSTHWREPHEPSTGELRTLDILARLAADLIDRKQVEDEIRETNRTYRELVRHAPAAIFEVNHRSQRLTTVNEAMSHMSGYSREELLGMNFFDLVDEESKARLQRRVTQWLRGEEPDRRVEYKVKAKNGRIIDAVLDATFTMDENGKPLGAKVVAHDVTARKQEERRISRYNNILKGINRIFERVIRTETEEALGKTFLDVALEVTGSNIGFVGEIEADGQFHDIAISDIGWDQCRMDDKSGHRRIPGDLMMHGLYGRIIEKQKGLYTNDLPSHPDSIGLPHGHPPLKCFLGIPLIHMGRTIGMLAVANREGGYNHEQQEDLETLAPTVIEALFRKRAEAALRESEQKFRFVFEQSAIGMGRVRFTDARWIDVNDAFCRMIGYSREEMLRIAWPQITHPDDVDLDLIPFRRMAAGELDSYTVEKRYIHKQGAFIWARLTLSLVRDEQGRPDYEIAIIENITDRKRAEQNLKQLTETLEQQVAERTELAEARTKQLQRLAVDLIEAEERERQRIAGLLHDDLQQLIASARMQVQSASQKENPGPVLQKVERLLGVSIEKSRFLSHQLSPPVLHQFGLAAALEWLVRHVDEQFGLEVQLEAEPAHQIKDAPLRVFLFRAVQELLFNVTKHSGVKSARVCLSGHDNRLALSVSDQGRGFNPDTLDDSSAEKAGLGLVSLRERARAVGGDLVIDSAPERGSRFSLTIPLSLAEADEPQKFIQAAEPPPGVYEKQMALSDTESISVLFADDHKVMRQGLIGLIAGQPDIQVAGEAANGEEALELARQLRPDVIVMDVSMPGMDGVEATRLIKAEIPEVRVIGLSMFEDDNVARKMLREGAEAFLSKTASSAELLKAIYGIAGQRKGGRC